MRNYFLITILLIVFNSYSQHQVLDTIYIDYEANCLKSIKNPVDNKINYIFSGNSQNGIFWFNEENKIFKSHIIKSEIKLCERILNKKIFYTYRKNQNLRNSYAVYKYFKSKIVYLIKEDELIKVIPNYAIE